MGKPKRKVVTITISVTFHISTLAMELLGDKTDVVMTKIAETAQQIINTAETEEAHVGTHFLGGINEVSHGTYVFNGEKTAPETWNVYVDAGYMAKVDEFEIPDDMPDDLRDIVLNKFGGGLMPTRIRLEITSKHSPAADG